MEKYLSYSGLKPYVGVAVASVFVNLLYLTSSLFMLQVYDRVIPSKSLSTLFVLSIFAAFLFVIQAVFDVLRARVLSRAASIFEKKLLHPVYNAVVRAPLRGNQQYDGMQTLRDLDQVRNFVGGAGPSAFFDLPWVPIYLAICFMFHWTIGVVTIIGAIVLLLLTFLTNRATAAPARGAAEFSAQRSAFLSTVVRNAEVTQAMGMSSSLFSIWNKKNAIYHRETLKLTDVASGFGIASKTFRVALQSMVLGVGAFLVIQGDATGGIMIASSILTSRALAPIDQVIANWRSFVAARQSWAKLCDQLAKSEKSAPILSLPRPSRSLVLTSLAGGPPNSARLTFAEVSLSLAAGDALGVIGPSASGKSSLARVITGVWPAFRGSIRLDGAAMDQWNSDDLGACIGYLPQDVGLFAGTVAANISRFEEKASSDEIIRAASLAGVHDLILRLPNGYDTEIGEGGASLSAGQRQRIGLARALYRDPFLIVLDEPNSNLDAAGEEALSEAIGTVTSRGGIVIVIAHRPSALAQVNLVMMMADGRVQEFGTKEDVFGRVLRPTRVAGIDRGGLKVVGEEEQK